MHSFHEISDYAEQKRLIEPILQGMGKVLPAEDCAIAFVECDESGDVVGFQVLQNALFAEGLWAKEGGKANLRTLWHRMRKWIIANWGEGKDLYVMAADEKVAQACKTMGCEELPWRIFRRSV